MITVSLATIREREQSLKETIESLLPQVDKINVFLHGYDYLPPFLKNDKIETAFDLEWGDKKDLDKFAWIDETIGYHLIVDDDLVFPPDFAKYMVKKIDEHKCFVSCHGSVPLEPPIASYYFDRISYPCLDEVTEDTDVSIIGTGCMGYYTDTGITDFQIKDLPLFMADIHFSLYLLSKKIPMKVVAHKKDWIKHSEKVDLEKTIYSQEVGRDVVQTKYINDNYEYFKKRQSVNGMPKVAICVANTRQWDHLIWYKECLDSIRNQIYPNIVPLIIDNQDRLMTIGKCWNDAADSTDAKYIYFLGDDDFITDDFITSSVDAIEKERAKDEKVVGMASYLQMFSTELDEQGKAVTQLEPRELIPTGMWLTDFIKSERFVEYKIKQVDTEFMDRIAEKGFIQKAMKWHYGYYYRTHSGQTSGRKRLLNGRGATTIERNGNED